MRRLHIFIAAFALIAGACTTSGTGPTPLPPATSLVVTTTSTTPPPTLVVAPTVAATSIEIWVPGDLASQVRDTATAFEIETGIGTEITVVEVDTVLAQLLADPAAGPDVFIGPHTWLTALTDSGIAEPLPASSEVVAGALETVTLRGIVFGAPLALDTIVQFRNVVAMATPPATVESLAQGCPQDDEVVPCLLLAADSVDGHYPFLAASGGYVFGPDEFAGWDADDVGVDTAEALAGANILTTIVAGAGILGDGSSTAADRFIAGEAPLLWGNTATLAALSLAGIEFTVERLPPIAETTAPTPVRVTAAWVNAFSEGKDAAVQFVGDYLAAPSSAEAIAVTLKLAPANIGFDANSDLVAFIESARTGDPVPTIFQTDYAWEQLALAFADIRDGDDAAEVLSDAAVIIRGAPEQAAPAEEEAEG